MYVIISTWFMCDCKILQALCCVSLQFYYYTVVVIFWQPSFILIIFLYGEDIRLIYFDQWKAKQKKKKKRKKKTTTTTYHFTLCTYNQEIVKQAAGPVLVICMVFVFSVWINFTSGKQKSHGSPFCNDHSIVLLLRKMSTVNQIQYLK